MKNSGYIFFLFFSVFCSICFSQSDLSLDCILTKARAFAKTNQDSAFFYSKLAYEKASENKDTTLIYKIVTVHGKNLINKKLFEEAEQLLRFNLYHKEALDDNLLGVTYYNLGALYQVKQERDSALENYFYALDYFTKSNNYDYLAKTNLYIGVVIQKGDKYYNSEQSDYFYEKSLQYSKLLKKEEGSSHDNLSRLGAIPLDVKIKSSEQALNAIKKPINSRLASVLHYNMSKNYYTGKRYHKAIFHAEKSIVIKKNIGFTQNIDYSYFTIGSSYMALDRYQKSIDPLNKVIQLSSKRELRLQAQELLVTAHHKIGDYKTSLNILQNLSSIKDSIALIQENARVAEITAKYETEKQAKEILVLKQENQEKELLIAKQENRRWRWTLAVLLSTLAAIWLANRYLKSLKKVKEVEQEKEIIAKKVEEEFIVLNNKTKIYLKELKYIKAASNYLEFYTEDKTIIDRNKLKVVEEQLPPNFIRTHRSYIVNKNYIISANSAVVIIRPDIETPLSRTFKGSLS